LLDYIENYILYYKESPKLIRRTISTGVTARWPFNNRRKEAVSACSAHAGLGKELFDDLSRTENLLQNSGNTFVIVNDRDSRAIFRNFLETKTVEKNEARVLSLRECGISRRNWHHLP
jgi:type I restriction enzyme R subunit